MGNKINGTFSVITYNILANAYLRPELYARVPAEVLEPVSRRQALLKKVSGANADIICLQEVEPAVFDHLDVSLNAQGYTGHFTPKGQNRPDGCAMFIRTPRFTVQTFEELYYADGAKKGKNSGHAAQVACLEYELGTVGIINTHLRWDPPEEAEENRWGIAQIMEVLEHVGRMNSGEQIICGDFNVTPKNSLIALLRDKGFQDAFSGSPTPTCYANGQTEKLDYLVHSAGLSSEAMEVADIRNVEYLPSFEHPSDHIILGAYFLSRR